MLRDGVKLYNKYVDKDRLQRRQQQKTDRALAEYYQERLLRNRFIRIRSLGNYTGSTDSDSDCTVVTVIDNSKGASTSAPPNIEADSITKGVNVTKRRPHRVERQQVKRSVGSNGVLTRSRTKAAFQLKTSIKAPPLQPPNQLVSTSRIRKLRSNFPQNGHTDDDVLFLSHKDFPTGDDGVAMHVEVANQKSQNKHRQVRFAERIDIIDEYDSDDNDGILIIDESFDEDTLSRNAETLFNGDTSLANILSSRMESSELVCSESLDIRYMHASFNESVELYLSQMNTQIEWIPNAIEPKLFHDAASQT